MRVQDDSLISRTGLKPDALNGQTALVTGAGGGIGYEAARAFLWLGARVIIAEIDEQKGRRAAEALGAEFAPDRVLYVPTDVGDEDSVLNLYKQAGLRFGKVDIVINNATIARLGLVKDVPIEDWDASYRVNLRGPVLLARTFLPGMLERNYGVFVNVSSTGTAYMGAYETFKAAQVHLANTLDAELENSNVAAFTVGPGLVPTDTATAAIEKLAPSMGMTPEEFFEQNAAAVLTVEEAGVGFAAAVVLADQFRGQEISSMQALKAAGLFAGTESESEEADLSSVQAEQALALCKAVRKTLAEQAEGWKSRSLFERQWVLRDFKKTAGMPVEAWLDGLQDLESMLGYPAPTKSTPRLPFDKLAGYYAHLGDLARGYIKDKHQLQENLRYIQSWQIEVEELVKLLKISVSKV
jgi:NAD(P)-dependent dehydrogenase (short-subunit alcohol dehydrogenase family)